MSTKLSIILPVYNNFNQLCRCLQSLKQQTVFELYKNEAEVIVVNDGGMEIKLPTLCHPHESEDPVDINHTYFCEHRDSRSTRPAGGVRDEVGGNDKRGDSIEIKTFTINHSGAPAARNFGFAKSTGQYIFFCDSDVVFLKKDALEKMLAFLEKNPDKAYCYSSFKFGWKTFKLFPFDQEKLKQNNYISTMSLIRRDALEKIKSPNTPFDESIKKFQDWDLWLALLKVGESGVFLDEVLWQAKSGGTMSNWLPKFIYKLPFLKFVQNYEKHKKIVQTKHGLFLSSPI